MKSERRPPGPPLPVEFLQDLGVWEFDSVQGPQTDTIRPHSILHQPSDPVGRLGLTGEPELLPPAAGDAPEKPSTSRL